MLTTPLSVARWGAQRHLSARKTQQSRLQPPVDAPPASSDRLEAKGLPDSPFQIRGTGLPGTQGREKQVEGGVEPDNRSPSECRAPGGIPERGRAPWFES